MSEKKNKIKEINNAQYREYLAVLRGDAALYGADGEEFIPKEIKPGNEDKKGE